MQAEMDALLNHFYNPGLKKIDLSLERMIRFLEKLENPHYRLPPVIHIAGTNGKGSLVAYLAAIGKECGLHVHRYISPHLVRFNERIVIDGAEITDTHLHTLLESIYPATLSLPVTFFEATTAAAFLAFAENPADLLLLETGMGGRFDATNVIGSPLLTAITPVSMDHTDFLGDTLEKIAYEKAGIIKPGVMCVVGPQEPAALAVIEQVAREKSAPLFRYGREWSVENGEYRSQRRQFSFAPALPGAHQWYNAATAIACWENIPPTGTSTDGIRQGIARAEWPARLQRLNGRLAAILPGESELWLDGGHNAAAGEVLTKWAEDDSLLPLIVVCGMVQGKDARGFLASLAPLVAHLYAVSIPGEETSQAADAIAQASRKLGISTTIAETIEGALQLAACQGKACRVLICGSLYLAGRVLKLNEGKHESASEH